MIFKHKLSRRLAALCGAALLALAVGCVDGPTESANSELLVGGAQSISPATAKVGDRVVANRWLQVLSGPSRRSNAIGHQAPGGPGTIVGGPTTVSKREPYPLWLVDFDNNPDGWVLGVYLDAAPVPPPADTTPTPEPPPADTTPTPEPPPADTTPTPPPPPPTDTTTTPGIGTPFFQSNWTTETGRSLEAFRDAARPTPWTFHCCDSNVNSSVETAAAMGLTSWPASNVYRVGTQASSQGSIQTHVVETDLGAPVAGERRYFRYYLQVVYSDSHGSATEGNIEHGVETAESGGGDGMNFYRLPRNDGTWFPAYREISSGVRYVASGLRLSKHRTYRLEWSLDYGASSYSVQVRIYDQTGTLVATEQDFFQYLPSRDTSRLLGAATFTYTPAHHRYFRVGTNGPSSNFPMANMTDGNLFLHGAVAVCRGGWCGPQATP